uniref:Predicted protein n=1 Tax=Hordeum vulgare subsp. vulgare TaxID=112509 RepID=F2DGX5_HORVV|nr:predicted protein [Hordeum vulgare subsp. vulgare]
MPLYQHHLKSESPDLNLDLNISHCSWSGGRHGAGEEEADGEAAEGPEGAEGQALHHPPLRRHASLLERLI